MNVVEFRIKQGDTKPDITAILRDALGVAVDLTSRTVRFRMRSFATGAILVDQEATPDPDQVTNKGKVTYAWQPGETDVAGYAFAEWDITTIGQSFPTNGWHLISVESSLDGGMPDDDFAQVRRLRAMVAEGTQDSYTDALLHAILILNDYSIESAAAQVWREKAAEYSDLVDTSEGGSTRKLSQLYDRAAKQAEYYEGISGTGSSAPVVTSTVVRKIER